MISSERLDWLFHHCADLGVDVEWASMQEKRRGEYRDSENLIVLSVRLTEAQAVSVLAHELGHRAFGDTHSTGFAERRAWQYAAAVLITPEEYRAAEALVGHHVPALAKELRVTTKLILAWQDWWHSTGQWIQEASRWYEAEDL